MNAQPLDDVIDLSHKYCVIGAGPSGLLAARSLKQAGIAYDQFDKNPDVGGIWDISADWSPMYESAHFISSKTVSNLPGYPMPDDYPEYPNHRQVLAYLRGFAEDYDLYDAMRFDTSVTACTRDGKTWLATLSDGTTRRYRGLFVCSGNTWDPNVPEYPGEFAGESIHSVKYKSADMFRGKRVLIVGGGNSGCDIACDAASNAEAAFLSLRRGYHFIPKFIFGKPADVFASGVSLPRAIEAPMFGALLKVLVGDLKGYGLPEPDHQIMESHPIVNTQVLHHLGHGDLSYRPDIDRLDGDGVVFKDGTREPIDLIVYATGYKVTYPFLRRDHFDWIGKYPDLYLSSLHRRYDNMCCLGLHQTDGGAFDFFAMQADMMANFILDQDRNIGRANCFRQLKSGDRPDLTGGIRYVNSDRHRTYVKKAVFARYCDRLFKRFGWRRFGLEARYAKPSITNTASTGAKAVGARPNIL